jgi:putative membrane protein
LIQIQFTMILRFLLSGLAVVVAGYLLPGVHVESFLYALLVAIVLSVVNVLVKPILVIFTIPITVLTLGLFLLVINALMIMLVDALIPGFKVDGFWWALAFSLILSLINGLFGGLVEDKK